MTYANRRAGATTGAWPGINSFGGWKASGSTGRGTGGPYYVQQFMREQSRVRIRVKPDGLGPLASCAPGQPNRNASILPVHLRRDAGHASHGGRLSWRPPRSAPLSRFRAARPRWPRRRGCAAPPACACLLDVARVTHDAPPGDAPGGDARRAHVLAYLAAIPPGSPTDDVLLPLTADLWREILGRPVPDNQLALEILRDRAAALLYTGLFSLDDDTLAWLAQNRGTLADIYQNHSPIFGAFGRSIKVRGGRVEAPGGGQVRRGVGTARRSALVAA